MQSRTRLALLGLASFLSGLAAVAYELVWIRKLGELFGHAVLSIQVVLAVFFLGLGVGAWFGGRLADRMRGSIVLYVALEALIALCGLAFLPACGLLERVYFDLAPVEWSMAKALAVKGLASAVLLAVPTLAMGATLPALLRHVVHRSAALAPRLGWLYGTNTLGAAAAALATVVVFLPAWGVFGSILAAGGANVLALGLALTARLPAAAEATAAAPEARPGAAPSVRDRRLLLLTAALSGFVAVGLEVLWTRALASRFLSTVYSFAVILGAFLLALAVGSLVVTVLDRLRLVGRRALAVTMTCSGLAALASVALLVRMPEVTAVLGEGAGGWMAAGRRELVLALVVMAPSLLCFGINLPLAVHLAHREVRTVGRDLGGIWLANTCGSVAAPLLIGFVVLPWLGIKWTIVLVGWAAVLHGAFVLLPWANGAGRRWLPWAAAGLAALGTWLLPADVRLWRGAPDDRLVVYREGLMASVAVVDEQGGDRVLRLNHDYVLGTRRTRFAQARQAWVPLLLHGAPESGLVIGLGTGSTAGAAAAWGGLRLDVAEIVPELEALLPLFPDANFDFATRLARDPRIRLFAADARQFVRTTDARYDVVVGDLFVPWRAGEGAMYTREHFAAVRDALTEDGIFCQWLPLYQLRIEELRTIVATFLDVFPTTELWWLYFNVDQPVVGLVGYAKPRALDLASLGEGLADATRRPLLVRDGLDAVGPLAGSLVTDAAGLAAWVGDAPIETAARPRIEFLAPRHHLGRTVSPAAEGIPVVLDLAPPDRDAAADDRRAVGHLLRGLHAEHWANDPARALDELGAAIRLTPAWPWPRLNLERVAGELLRRGDSAAVERIAGDLRTAPELAWLAHHFDALLALAADDREGARRAVREALRGNPDHEASRRLLAFLDEG